jgi:hypothetical protein
MKGVTAGCISGKHSCNRSAIFLLVGPHQLMNTFIAQAPIDLLQSQPELPAAILRQGQVSGREGISDKPPCPPWSQHRTVGHGKVPPWALGRGRQLSFQFRRNHPHARRPSLPRGGSGSDSVAACASAIAAAKGDAGQHHRGEYRCDGWPAGPDHNTGGRASPATVTQTMKKGVPRK